MPFYGTTLCDYVIINVEHIATCLWKSFCNNLFVFFCENTAKQIGTPDRPGLEIHFFGGSKLLLLSSRPDSKTSFVVAKLYVHFYAAVILGCVDDRITNITQKCI